MVRLAPRARAPRWAGGDLLLGPARPIEVTATARSATRVLLLRRDAAGGGGQRVGVARCQRLPATLACFARGEEGSPRLPACRVDVRAARGAAAFVLTRAAGFEVTVELP